MKAPFFLTVLSLALLGTLTTRAQSPDVDLIWERPVGSLCPTRAALEADVERIMGRRVFGAGAAASVFLRGEIEDNLDEVRVFLEARSASGERLGTRRLSAPPGRCDALRGAIALVLTLFVERASAPAEDYSALRFGWGASASVATTPLPRAAFAFGPAFSLDLGPELRFRAAAAYWLPVRIHTPSGVGAELHAWTLALRACAGLWANAFLGFRLCAGLEGGALVSTPLRLIGPDEQARFLGHGMLELHAEARLGGFALLDLAVGPLVSMSRPSFSYRRSDGERMPVYRPEPFGAIFQVAFIILGS